jgi:MoxR-like ATPase
MATPIVRFTQGAASRPSRSEVDLERPQDVEKARETDLPEVIVLNLKYIPGLRKFRDLIVDRGKKHKSKPLSKILLGCGKIPVIDGNFSSLGQLRRSVVRLLGNAGKINERNLYIIGVAREIFDELWMQVGAGGVAPDNRQDSIKTRGFTPSAGTEPGSFSRSLLELMDTCDIPPELEAAFLGKSEDAKLVRQLIMKAAFGTSPVLILGDTGTGKSIAARQIHECGPRKGLPFRSINCGAIPKHLLELELFGMEPNVIHMGNKPKIGLWEDAGDGTLFLDEIGDLMQEHQVKILHSLDTGKIRRIGGNKDIEVHARIIAATNRDLYSMVQDGRYREDLYHRLRGFTFWLPPLRDRLGDIPVLANTIWRRITGDSSDLPDEVLEEMQAYSWPGNVRELKNLLKTVYELFQKKDLQCAHFRMAFDFERKMTRGDAAAENHPQDGVDFHQVECLYHLRRAGELIHAIRVMLGRMVEKDGNSERDSTQVKNSLSLRLHELELLCNRPLLFHSEIAFTMVYRLMGKLTYFGSLLQKDTEKARRYWRKEITDELELVQSSIFKEVERIVERV